jgi:hypothetical protein
MTMDNNSVKDKVWNKLSEPVQFTVWVKQGDGLSNAPSNFTLYSVINSIYQTETFS